ncbi:MAG TPA: Gfo/Idh/MocA family oxidoreductase [Candidatus Binataceae bacterium]|jgi:predicted dehydrogenase|nr:Gfo/Idh/MocA family oxidoreductase [Candidatus Binataceae bacterium]
MNELRAAVVGVGRLGAIHARKYAAIPNVKLTCVVDTNTARAAQIAAELGATGFSDYRQLAGTVDIASVAAPGVSHHAIACDLMRAGIDVLVEKPMAATLAEARDMKAVAERYGRVLQIGHLERFNPAIVRLRSILNAPRFVECHRLAPFTERGTDVDVVLDLMVHDLDVILSATGALEVVSLEALGVAVLTDQIDVANARIRFDNGLIANLNTSRVAPRRERKIRFFQPDAYLSVDYEARRIQVYRKSPPAPGSAFPTISAEQIDLADGDPLMDEVTAFVESVRTRGVPQVTADDGLRVMELSERIRIEMERERAAFPG